MSFSYIRTAHRIAECIEDLEGMGWAEGVNALRRVRKTLLSFYEDTEDPDDESESDEDWTLI